VTRPGGRKAAGRPGAIRFLEFVAGVLLTILALPALAIAAWAVVFGVPTPAVIAFTAGWLLLPLFHSVRAVRVFKVGVSFLLLPATLSLSPLMVREVNSRIEELRGRERTNPAAFSLRDKAGIYGLNIVMAAAAAPVYPEAALETFLMVFRPPAGRLRTFDSRFGLGSQRLRQRLAGVAREFEADTAGVREFGPAFIEWDREEYRFGNPEARYALALNQTHLRARFERQGTGWRADVRHLVGIGYPRDAYVPLITRPKLSMEEGLFWVLQEAGWLHKYNAEWRFSVGSDEFWRPDSRPRASVTRGGR
jgi:hypothetical protein